MLDETKDNGGLGDRESIDTVHGRLMEDAYYASHGFELMCQKLEWELAEDPWKSAGFKCINDFLATLRLPRDFRLLAERRKPIALQLKKLGASERAIGRTLGVDKNTVRADLGKIPHKSKTQAAECNGYGNDGGEDSPLWTPSGSDTAKAVKRMAAKKAKRDRAYGKGRWIAQGNAAHCRMICASAISVKSWPTFSTTRWT